MKNRVKTVNILKLGQYRRKLSYERTANDYPAREYTSSEVEAPGSIKSNLHFMDDDIVCSLWKHRAVSENDKWYVTNVAKKKEMTLDRGIRPVGIVKENIQGSTIIRTIKSLFSKYATTIRIIKRSGKNITSNTKRIISNQSKNMRMNGIKNILKGYVPKINCTIMSKSAISKKTIRVLIVVRNAKQKLTMKIIQSHLMLFGYAIVAI